MAQILSSSGDETPWGIEAGFGMIEIKACARAAAPSKTNAGAVDRRCCVIYDGWLFAPEKQNQRKLLTDVGNGI
jgi:hypothetical protein